MREDGFLGVEAALQAGVAQAAGRAPAGRLKARCRREIDAIAVPIPAGRHEASQRILDWVQTSMLRKTGLANVSTNTEQSHRVDTPTVRLEVHQCYP